MLFFHACLSISMFVYRDKTKQTSTIIKQNEIEDDIILLSAV